MYELHFRKEYFFYQDTTWRKTGRKQKMLKRAAIPSIFHSYPKYYQPKVSPKRTMKTTQEARRVAENIQLQKQIDDVFQKEKINDIWAMWDKIQNETLPAGYTISKLTPPDIDNFVISIRTEELNIETGLLLIKFNLAIYSDLHYKMYVCNTEIPSSKASKLTNKSGICGSTTEVLNILALLITLTVDSITAMNCVRQFMEGEAVIRAKNMISLSGFSPREVASLMKEAKELRRIDDDRVIDKLFEAASQADDSIVNEGTEQAMHHVAGYLARTTRNTHKCQPCQDLLVNREASQGSFINNSEEIAEETNSKSTFSFTD